MTNLIHLAPNQTGVPALTGRLSGTKVTGLLANEIAGAHVIEWHDGAARERFMEEFIGLHTARILNAGLKFGAERAEYLRSARAHADQTVRAKFVALARSAHRDLMRERLS